MKTHASRAFAATIGAAAVLAGSATVASAAEPVTTNALASPAAYTNYLQQSGEEGALDTLKQFQALAPTEQSRFLGYLKDPSLYKEFLASAPVEQNGLAALTEDTSLSASLHNGDVTYESDSTVSGLTAAASGPLPKGDHTVKRSNKIKVFGVTVVELKIWETFHSNGHDVTKVVDGDGGKKNFSVVASVTKERPKRSLGTQQFCERGGSCVGGHLAIQSIIWNVKATVSGGAVEYDKKQTLSANVYGSAHATLKNV
ncbi:hypothetical protein [Streptomyces justiciae]|uniref:hypothetical protein n=1 Tax=Streptomyces justiciae TaxID=2780140 RepID=UPI002117FD47|nr:hypothetical protein [Streptomyces justiciae]MCW8382014.1 hypothetical protein [Streptomyces justiciae]